MRGRRQTKTLLKVRCRCRLRYEKAVEFGTLCCRRSGGCSWYRRIGRGREQSTEIGGGIVVLISRRCGGCRCGLVVLCLASLHQRMKVEFVGIPLPVYLGHNIFVVIIPAEEDQEINYSTANPGQSIKGRNKRIEWLKNSKILPNFDLDCDCQSLLSDWWIGALGLDCQSNPCFLGKISKNKNINVKMA